MSKLFETLHGTEYYRAEIERIFKKHGVGVSYRPSEVFSKPAPTSYLDVNGQDALDDIYKLIFAAGHHCGTCGESRSGDCSRCERLWST